jgi:hypothetical protein
MRTVYEKRPGVERAILQDASDEGTFHIETVHHVGGVIEEVAKMREMNQVIGHRKSRMMTHVAEIPMQVVEQAHHEGWFHDQKKWKQWLNDPGNRPLRVTDGKV